MSYARKNYTDSDIYVVRVSDTYYCHACKLVEDSFVSSMFFNLTALYDHLLDHIEMGHKVAERTLTRVSLELENETQS